MNRLSKVSLRLSVLCISALIAGTYSAGAVESQNVVGFFKVDITNGWNLISVPMQKMTVISGQITPSGNVTATTIGDTASSWSDGQFAAGVVTTNTPESVFKEPGASTFYFEITGPTNSPFVGRHVYISNNAGTDLTIAGGVPADMQSGLANETYKIVPAYRVRDVFGEPGKVKLAGAGSEGLADNIWTFNAGGGYNGAIYYNTGAGMWVQSGVGPANDFVLDRDTGFFVNRLAAGGATNLVITGEVSDNPQQVVMVPGWQIIGGHVVIDQTMAGASLSNVLDGAGSEGLADNIWAFNNGGGYQGAIYYNTGAGMWVQSGVGPANDYQMKAGQAYFVNVRSNSTQWIRSSPLQ